MTYFGPVNVVPTAERRRVDDGREKNELANLVAVGGMDAGPVAVSSMVYLGINGVFVA